MKRNQRTEHWTSGLGTHHTTGRRYRTVNIKRERPDHSPQCLNVCVCVTVLYGMHAQPGGLSSNPLRGENKTRAHQTSGRIRPASASATPRHCHIGPAPPAKKPEAAVPTAARGAPGGRGNQRPPRPRAPRPAKTLAGVRTPAKKEKNTLCFCCLKENQPWRAQPFQSRIGGLAVKWRGFPFALYKKGFKSPHH